jgi:diguanylate cyclase (GGDEF)-like protein/putative nucleotidyltransferase with HDIG domain
MRPSTLSIDHARRNAGASINPGADRALMARSLMYLSLAGALIAFVSVLLPHREQFDERGMLTIAACSLASALVLFAGGKALPGWAFPVLLAAATLLVEWAIFASGEEASPYAAFYFWIAIYAFYFFTRRQAILQVLFIVAVYAAVLAFVPDPTSPPVLRWAITMSALVVGGAMIGVLQERLARLARAVELDAPTDLLNRRGLHDVLDAEFERARRHDLPLAIAIVEVQGLAAFDDRGRRSDGLLARVGAFAQSFARDSDAVGRIASERLGFVLPHTDRDGALIFCERLLRSLRDLLASEDVELPVSVGLAAFPADAQSAEALVHRSTQAVTAAEHLGRDRVVVYSPEIGGIVLAAESRRGQDRGSNLAAVLALTEVLDIRDAGTAQHSQTVGRYAEAIARALELPDELVERVRLAGILHDVGKIAVPDAVLSKPGKLTDDEWDQMRKHPEVGALIVDGAELQDVAAWVGAHHERPDGAGYPRALAGDQIPLEARILAVADAYEAMTCDRVYRRALPVQVARDELRKGAGRQFDERVVDVFIAWLEDCDTRGEAVETDHFASLVRGLSEHKLV